VDRWREVATKQFRVAIQALQQVEADLNEEARAQTAALHTQTLSRLGQVHAEKKMITKVTTTETKRRALAGLARLHGETQEWRR
jgi:hypothetical protein